MSSKTETPLVSCIMPTFNRRSFVPRAIRCFLRQDYPNSELIIIDDGDETVEDLVPHDSRIRYIHIGRRATVGEKRNIACDRAAGSLIAHWDDDDWNSPARIRLQVEALVRSSADLCGLMSLYFFEPGTGRAWRYTYPAGHQPWVAGGSLLYSRAFWLSHPFRKINIGEDSEFVWSAHPERVVIFPDPSIYLCTIHDRNVSTKETSTPGWERCSVEQIVRVLGHDKDFIPDEPSREDVVVFRPPMPSGRSSPLRNVFACLVHESPDCIGDLVRNLRSLDPASRILLYNGSRDPDLLKGNLEADIFPTPRPMSWGCLHDFAVDCMRFARTNIPFDTLTIVDSDQLALRPGYSDYLTRFLAERPGVGMLANVAGVQPSTTTVGPAKAAHAEIELWRPFLRRFPNGEQNFVHWAFWPCTVFTSDAAATLVNIFDEDKQLQQILLHTRIWATEEVILPTLVALLGFRIEQSPCSYDFVKFQTTYTAQDLEDALARADVFWMHPVPRQRDHTLRRNIRLNYQDYPVGVSHPTTIFLEAPGALVRTLPILARIRKVEGWLDEDEADLLIAATSKALTEYPAAEAIVEVGSYCGRATIALASVLRQVQPKARVWSIDPHDGKLGTTDRYITVAPSREILAHNLSGAGLNRFVQIVQARAPEVTWQRSIALLLIDGLHDRASVTADFMHFEPWLVPGGYVAFHDYADYFPDVVSFVNQLLGNSSYQGVGRAGSLIVLRKLAPQQR